MSTFFLMIEETGEVLPKTYEAAYGRSGATEAARNAIKNLPMSIEQTILVCKVDQVVSREVRIDTHVNNYPPAVLTQWADKDDPNVVDAEFIAPADEAAVSVQPGELLQAGEVQF